MIVGEIISFDTQLNKNQSYLPLDPILPYLETFLSMQNLLPFANGKTFAISNTGAPERI